MPPTINEVRETYDRLAPQYDVRWRFYVDATLAAVVEVLELEGGERVLDLACGTGELERRLADRWPGLSIVGVDLSMEMLRVAASKAADHLANWLRADIGRLPVTRQRFDWVICANAFHYFRAPRDYLAEMRRVLRPGGRLVLVDWCDDYLACKLCSIWLRWTNPAFHRTYTQRACRELVEQAGFTIKDSTRFRINWLWGMQRIVARS